MRTDLAFRGLDVAPDLVVLAVDQMLNDARLLAIDKHVGRVVLVDHD